MMIRKECLGLVIRKKSPFNSEVFTLTIANDPAQFNLYKILGLDVFEKDIPPIAIVTHNDDHTKEVEFLKDIKPKKKKKGDTSEID